MEQMSRKAIADAVEMLRKAPQYTSGTNAKEMELNCEKWLKSRQPIID